MLVRFRQDVVNLWPKAVAKTNEIKVVLASKTPAGDFWWNPGTKSASKIAEMNARIKEYSASHGLVYLDYYSAMVDDNGGMKREFTGDGVHPNAAGYAVMGKLAEVAILAALADRSAR